MALFRHRITTTQSRILPDSFHVSNERSETLDETTCGLSEDKVEAARQTLEIMLWDSDIDIDSGKIPVAELPRMLRAVGQNPAKVEISEALYSLQLQHAKIITYGEFTHIWARVTKDKDLEDKILSDAFFFFDRDGSGSITKEEFVEVMSELGDVLTLDELDLFIRLMDKNGDGLIQFDEFMTALRTTENIGGVMFDDAASKEAARTSNASP